jgi:hypothetical protein
VARLVVGGLFTGGSVVLALHLAGPAPVAAAESAGVGPRPALEDALGRPAGALPVPVDLDRARRVLPGFERLGPVHVDPFPPGVSPGDATDTASLYARAGLARAHAGPAGSKSRGSTSADAVEGEAAPAQRQLASDIPPGTPSTKGLSQHVAPSCSGTGTDGRRVQVLYVREASTPSRYAEMLPLFRNEIANVDDVFALSARQSGGTRRVRWVHQACVPVVPEVVVPDGALNPSFSDTITALANLGFNDKDRKYLAFTEANDLCGVGTSYDDSRVSGNANDGYAASYARVDELCWSPRQHSAAAHELTHTLGGVLDTAPHATAYGHCYDESDLMCYDDGSRIAMLSVCAADQEQLLDCNGDDYFNTAPAAGSFLADHWNTARSSFLDVPSLDPVAVAVAPTWTVATASGRDPVALSAVLSGPAGPVAGAAVELQTRGAAGQPWQTAVTGLTTGGDGRVTVERRRTAWAWYRFANPGDAGGTLAPGASGEVLVKARTKAKADWHGRTHRVTGRLRTLDGAPLAGVTVTLERRDAGSSRWVRVTKVTSTALGRLAVKQRPKRTAYFRWSYRGSDLLLPARSPSVRARRTG